MSEIEEKLLSVDESMYGEKYADHYLEQYKIYLGTADRISSRRHLANLFFLSINTAIFSLAGYFAPNAKFATEGFNILVFITGIILCFNWYLLVRSYKDLNSEKFRIICEIEKHLPLAIHGTEWESVGRGKDSKPYLPFTSIEMRIPLVFMVVYALAAIYYIPWEKFKSALCS